MLTRQDVQVSTIGRRDGIPDRVLSEMNKTIELCQGNHGMRLCLAINYGGRGELVDAIRCMVREAQHGQLTASDVDETRVAEYLYTSGMPDPDLLIRTAGEMRVSNFLLWQISYTELWVSEKCWPEFDLSDLHEAIDDFAKRQRRYGGLH